MLSQAGNIAIDSGAVNAVLVSALISPPALLKILLNRITTLFDFSATYKSVPVYIISTGLPSRVFGPLIVVLMFTKPDAVATFSIRIFCHRQQLLRYQHQRVLASHLASRSRCRACCLVLLLLYLHLLAL